MCKTWPLRRTLFSLVLKAVVLNIVFLTPKRIKNVLKIRLYYAGTNLLEVWNPKKFIIRKELVQNIFWPKILQIEII